MSRKPKEKAPPEPEAESEDEGQAPAKKKPPLLAIGAGALLFAASGAAAFLLAPGERAPAAAETHAQSIAHGATPSKGGAHADADSHGGKKGHGEKSGGEPPPVFGKFTVAGEAGFFLPDPFVVSVAPGDGVKHLKVLLAIEAPPGSAALYEAQSLRLRDTMTTYLRAVDVSVLRNPAEMSALREQLKRRVGFVVAPENVRDVLILDFILT